MWKEHHLTVFSLLLPDPRHGIAGHLLLPPPCQATPHHLQGGPAGGAGEKGNILKEEVTPQLC